MIEPVIIPRVVDKPHNQANPVQFSVTIPAFLSFGQYVFKLAGNKGERRVMKGTKNLKTNSLMILETISFSTDIEILDYQKALEITNTITANGTVAGDNVNPSTVNGDTSVPQFFAFLVSNAQTPLLKDPILCQNYIDKQPFIEPFLVTKVPDVLSGFFTGALEQTAALAGLDRINFTFSFYGYEVTDQYFRSNFMRGYPKNPASRDGMY